MSVGGGGSLKARSSGILVTKTRGNFNFHSTAVRYSKVFSNIITIININWKNSSTCCSINGFEVRLETNCMIWYGTFIDNQLKV